MQTQATMRAPTIHETINLETLKEKLLKISGAKFTSFVAVTVPDMYVKNQTTKEPNPYLTTLTKESKVFGLINWIYENAVNNQREREGLTADFEAMPRSWGTRITGTPLVEHNGNFYMEVKIVRVLSERFLDDGVEIAKGIVAPFLRPSRASNRQGVASPVRPKDFALKNIREIKLGGKLYRIENDY